MPQQPANAEVRMNNVIACLTPAVTILKDISDAFETPFIQAIGNTTLSLIASMQSVKNNKDECVRLIENVHQVLDGIINLNVKSNPPGSLAPATLCHVRKFMESLHKIHMFVEGQQEGNKIRQFLRQSEMKTLLNQCRTGLQEACEVFQVDRSATIFGNIREMQKKSEAMHKELLELISTMSDGTISDMSSSLTQQIFHGRGSELHDIVETLGKESPRIAILGAGGMGKTSLARAALHHPNIAAKYEHRFFVVTESATTSIELAGIIGSHLGLKSSKDITKAVLGTLCNRNPCLLILDNLETVWEPMESRSGVEQLLSRLSEIPHLALIITMRGAERPAEVRWTRPFLQPLKPLSDDAAWKTFVDIAADSHDSKEITQLLAFTDNMPLAVDIMAHLVDYEGCPNILARWENEKTAMLSNGYDRRSNLDISVTISLASPRMSPGAMDLLSLLSILPDGLSEIEMLQSKLPIRDVLTCKATLLGTSLAYSDDRRRLKSLVPIREHMQHFYPVAPALIDTIRKYFHPILNMYRGHLGPEQNWVRGHINSNLGNLHQVLLRGLHPENLHLEDTINCILSLNAFSRVTGHGHAWQGLMDLIPGVLSPTGDARLEVSYITEIFYSSADYPVPNPEKLLSQAISHFHDINDPVLEFIDGFYHAVGHHYFVQHNLPAAIEFLDKAMLASHENAGAFRTMALIRFQQGDYLAAQSHARKMQRVAHLCADVYIEAHALHVEAMCGMALGDYRTSISQCQRARQLLERCGMSPGGLDRNIMNIEGEVHLLKSEYVEARSLHTQIVQSISAEKNAYDYALGLLNLAQIDILAGADEKDVKQNLDKAKSILYSMDRKKQLNFCDMLSAALNLRAHNFSIAKGLFQRCLEAAWQNDSQAVDYGLGRVSDVSQWPSDDFMWGSRWTVVYLAYTQKYQSKLGFHKALQFMGHIFMTQGDEDTAHSLFIVALEGFTFMDVQHSRAQCMLRLGDISKGRGNLKEAVELWKRARPLFERSLQTNEITHIDTRLAPAKEEISNNHSVLVKLGTLEPNDPVHGKVANGDV
ncbi:hypothetical protein DFH09DRAFT_1291617 [Mycena vulgaris]|nr:hypothetical protein DFH09DRAFT_1291617 [Mycena vulgaris]